MRSANQRVGIDADDPGAVAPMGEIDFSMFDREDENAASLEAGAHCPYMFFDIESYPNAAGHHVPYLIVAIHANEERHIFQGDDCMTDFCEFAFSPEHKNYRFYSHNG